VSPTNGLVVFAKGIAGSLVLVSTSGALIRRALVTGASIIGASITGTSIISTLIIGASIIRASNLARKRSYSSSFVDSRRYSSFSYFLSSFK
jgi:hypothetical protein